MISTDELDPLDVSDHRDAHGGILAQEELLRVLVLAGPHAGPASAVSEKTASH
jgi:hypothetical protein